MNWEYGVLAWAKDNLPDFSSYNQSITTTNQATSTSVNIPPKIEIKNPVVGSFISGPININAAITASAPIAKIRVYFNNQLVDDSGLSGSLNYNFNWSFTPRDTQPQNLIQVEVVDQNNISTREGVIVYGQ